MVVVRVRAVARVRARARDRVRVWARAGVRVRTRGRVGLGLGLMSVRLKALGCNLNSCHQRAPPSQAGGHKEGQAGRHEGRRPCRDEEGVRQETMSGEGAGRPPRG